MARALLLLDVPSLKCTLADSASSCTGTYREGKRVRKQPPELADALVGFAEEPWTFKTAS